MEMIVEYQASELFDVDHVTVNQGLVQPFRYPKSQFFGWKNPEDGRDLVLFIGEAQPPSGRYNFCRKLIDYAQQLGVSIHSIFIGREQCPPILKKISRETSGVHFQVMPNKEGMVKVFELVQ